MDMLRKFFTKAGYSIILILILCAGCSKTPKDVIDEDEMVELLADMSIAEAYKSAGVGKLPDSIRRNLGEGILAGRGYTYQQLDTSIAWYGRHIDKYYELYDRVGQEIVKRQRRIAKASGESEMASMNAENLWPYNENMMISRLGNNEGVSFAVSAASLLKGERLEWQLRLNKGANIKAILGVEYTDGTVAYAHSGSYGERKVKVNLITDTARQAKRIIGILHADQSQLPLWADSIRITKLPFDSTEYYRINVQRNYGK